MPVSQQISLNIATIVIVAELICPMLQPSQTPIHVPTSSEPVYSVIVKNNINVIDSSITSSYNITRHPNYK